MEIVCHANNCYLLHKSGMTIAHVGLLSNRDTVLGNFINEMSTNLTEHQILG